MSPACSPARDDEHRDGAARSGLLGGGPRTTRRHGTLLVIDETHTISSGPGGYAVAHDLEPDMLVVGKPIAGGVPCAVYGFSAELAERAKQAKLNAPPGHSGIGTTLTANMLAMHAMRATLAEVATDAAYAHMFELAARLATKPSRRSRNTNCRGA